ncbi:MAG: response regulator [Lachnospiraceae bacterium]
MNKVTSYQILLAEDEPLLMQSLARHIEELNMGFTVAAKATNGQEALQFLDTHTIHVVMTDVIMPVMDGLELAREIHQRHTSIKTIIVSGHADFAFAQKALSYGVSDYLLKPVSSEKLENTLLKIKLELGKLYDFEDDVSLMGRTAETIAEYAALYMRENFRTPIDLTALAQKLGFSSAYLTKIFNKYTGHTPVKFLTDLRINEAKQLLTNTELPISQIGEKVGYPDQFYFSKTFRKITGLSPTVFRNTHADT